MSGVAAGRQFAYSPGPVSESRVVAKPGPATARGPERSNEVMAYIFQQDELPRLISAVPGRERVFFVSKELSSTDAMLAGIMHYDKGAASPYHLHENCEHFYFIFDGEATIETEEGTRPLHPGELVFIPAEAKHRLRATEPLFYFEFQAPNRFKTTILDGTQDDLLWERVDGKVWVQS
jgi:mannose-6-phosphate isomerase-like protein (cupin superfamily)